MIDKYAKIMQEFRMARPDYLQLEAAVDRILHTLLKDSGVRVSEIQHRVKEEDSLRGKLLRKGDHYNSLSDLTDILGGRIICYFADDVDKVGALLEENFEIDWENTTDKRALLKPDTFGYLSMHYICSLPFGKGYPDAICGKKFEIQIRTMLQHVWACMNHCMGYKNDFGIPRQESRRFSRLAGLLEMADEQFMQLRENISSYTEGIRSRIADNTADDIPLDAVSLREFIARNKNMRSYMDALSAETGAEITMVDPVSLLEYLNRMGKHTLGDLQDMLEAGREQALQLAKLHLQKSGMDIITSTACLRFLCNAELLSREGENKFEQALEFAGRKHEGQTRRGGDPYITHPEAVAGIVAQWGYGMDYRITALFHDLLEDTDATPEEILRLGGGDVLQAVQLLTKEKGYVMAEYVAAIHENPIARVVKAADRLHNLRCAVCTDDDFKRRYILETIDWYMDLHPEIPRAVRDLAETMDAPIAELRLDYTPVEE